MTAFLDDALIIVQMDPGNAAAYQAWALLEKKDGNIQKAQQLLEYCLERNPMHEPSLHALAKLHLELCHFVQARQLLQRVLRINPSHPHSWTTLGELCYYQGDPAQSRRIYEQSVAYCGEDSVAYATWAHMEARMGDNGMHVICREAFDFSCMRPKYPKLPNAIDHPEA